MTFNKPVWHFFPLVLKDKGDISRRGWPLFKRPQRQHLPFSNKSVSTDIESRIFFSNKKYHIEWYPLHKDWVVIKVYVSALFDNVGPDIFLSCGKKVSKCFKKVSKMCQIHHTYNSKTYMSKKCLRWVSNILNGYSYLIYSV